MGIKSLKPSACTPLFLAAFAKRGAGCCIHTHSQWAVLITLLVEREFGREACFEIKEIEQIKGIPKGYLTDEQKEKGEKRIRNDRLIAVAETSQLFANFKTVDDLPKQLRTEIQDFFSNYHRLQGKQSRTLSWNKPATAERLIQQARKKRSAA